jgi:DNA-binding response OmpR family regulator
MDDAKGTILLVEDDENLRTIYQDILTFNGFQVLLAADGEEGWEMAKANKPDFILLDLEMPKLNGFQVLELIRGNSSFKNTPVIIFSGKNTETDVHKVLDRGANGFVIKGVHTPRYLLGLIKSLIPKKAVEPPPKAGLSKIQIKEYKENGAGQWMERISIAGYHCQECGEEYILEIFPEPVNEDERWFRSRFVCPKCSKVS